MTTHPSSPYYVGRCDGSAVMLVPHILDSSNYYTWARSMRRALRTKSQLGFIIGALCEPKDPNDPLMEHWLRCNDIVITLMQNVVAIDIKSSTIYVGIAHLLWLDNAQCFSQQNDPRIFEVKDITILMQNQDSVNSKFFWKNC